MIIAICVSNIWLMRVKDLFCYHYFLTFVQKLVS